MINCVVTHIIWGKGKILSKNEKYIKVLFDDLSIGEKTFVYPDAFSKYIAYEDKKYQAEVQDELQSLSRVEQERAAKLEQERVNAAAAAQEKEKNILSMKKKAIAYSRKRAEKLRAKPEKPAQESEDAADDAAGTDYYKDDDINVFDDAQ